MATVRIPPTLRTETGGEREVEAAGETVREVLENLTQRYPELEARIYADGGLARFVNAYVDGEDVRTLDGLETPVAERSTVILLPAMAGGRLASLTGCPSRPAQPASGAAGAAARGAG